VRSTFSSSGTWTCHRSLQITGYSPSSRAGGTHPRESRRVAGTELSRGSLPSFLAVYDETLFWTRAVQGVVLLLVAPLLLAVAAPLTLVQATVPVGVRARLGVIRRCSDSKRPAPADPGGRLRGLGGGARGKVTRR